MATATGRKVISKVRTGDKLVLVAQESTGVLMPTARKTGVVVTVTGITSELVKGSARKATRVYAITHVTEDGTEAVFHASPATTVTMWQAPKPKATKAAPAKARKASAPKAGRCVVRSGVALKEAVKAAGTTYREIGATYGVNPHLINRLVTGRTTELDIDKAAKIAEGCKCGIEALFDAAPAESTEAPTKAPAKSRAARNAAKAQRPLAVVKDEASATVSA